MMQEPAWSWPVKVQVPADGGVYVEQRFSARFRLTPAQQAGALLLEDPSGRALIRHALVGWSEVVDDAGKEVAFSAEAAELMLGIPYVFTALAASYSDSVAGAPRKN